MDYNVYNGVKLRNGEKIEDLYDHLLEDSAKIIEGTKGSNGFTEAEFVKEMLQALYRYEKQRFDLPLTFEEWLSNNGGCYRK